MKKYIGAILSIGTLLILFYTLFDLKNQVKEIPVLQHQVDSLSAKADSLQDELFNEKVESGRHEITLDEIIKRKYPKVYEEYNKYFENQTE